MAAPAAAAAAAPGKTKVIFRMDADGRNPLLGSFAGTDPERMCRLMQAFAACPEAITKVAKTKANAIVSASERGERCFTFGVLNSEDVVIEAETYAAGLLPWINKGELIKDKEFVRYVEMHNPMFQHPVYAKYPGGFQAVVIDSATLKGRAERIEDLVRSLQATTHVATEEEKENFKKICMNSSCGARNVPLFKCTRCKEVWYCCVECQKKDWKAHKVFCGALKGSTEK